MSTANRNHVTNTTINNVSPRESAEILKQQKGRSRGHHRNNGAVRSHSRKYRHVSFGDSFNAVQNAPVAVGITSIGML